MLKKGDLSINIIIIAIIALLVLVVIFAIFTGRMSIFNRGLEDQDVENQMAAEKLYAGSLNSEEVCGSAAICKSSCTADNYKDISDKPKEERCGLGLLCCEE
jgi:competence protein ComGC